MKTFRCDGCGEVAKRECPEGWVSVKVRVKLVRPIDVGLMHLVGLSMTTRIVSTIYISTALCVCTNI